MHGRMAGSCSNPVEPCCSPCRYHIAAATEQNHYKASEESHGVEILGEENRDER